MAAKKRKGFLTRYDKSAAMQQAVETLKTAKEMAGDVIHVSINEKTTIELPANFTQEQIDARVKNYYDRHPSKK